MVFIKNVLLDI